MFWLLWVWLFHTQLTGFCLGVSKNLEHLKNLSCSVISYNKNKCLYIIIYDKTINVIENSQYEIGLLSSIIYGIPQKLYIYSWFSLNITKAVGSIIYVHQHYDSIISNSTFNQVCLTAIYELQIEFLTTPLVAQTCFFVYRFWMEFNTRLGRPFQHDKSGLPFCSPLLMFI